MLIKFSYLAYISREKGKMLVHCTLPQYLPLHCTLKGKSVFIFKLHLFPPFFDRKEANIGFARRGLFPSSRKEKIMRKY